MKKIMLFFGLLLTGSCIYSQPSDITKIGLYTWTESVLMQPCSVDGTDDKTTNGGVTTTDAKVASKAGQKFRVLAIIDGANAIIQVLDYTAKASSGTKKYEPTTDFFKYNFKGVTNDYSSLADEAANARNYSELQRYFKVGVAYIDALATRESKIGGSLAAGVINFPFKFRPQKKNADFSGAFNFGAGIGYTFSHKSWRRFTYSVLSGYSISNVVLDSSNANKNQGQLSSTNNFTAFSFSLGFMAEHQRVQAGIFIGWDRIGKLNQRAYEWQYQGKPWISIGFGFAIFSGQKEKSEKNSDATNKSE